LVSADIVDVGDQTTVALNPPGLGAIPAGKGAFYVPRLEGRDRLVIPKGVTPVFENLLRRIELTVWKNDTSVLIEPTMYCVRMVSN
jgi:hypothetical protein